ncbi:MFS general substrate transporter [Obba rivulosa]|uniref:MFS general substrate transporter n=1 Tax=Obba rivulosa TaxID=1052685 RepID=A0A8E2AH74_9APHY|nr:MFS general substrate transporter [Obba rivulosa]
MDGTHSKRCFPVNQSRKPWGLKWRSSAAFVTFVVGLGVTTDLLVYSLIVPVIPFQLEHLGYQGVSGLVGWLLFAYSAGLVISTPPIAFLSERYNNRRIPFLLGQIALIGAQIMLMEAPTYWMMALARIIQGISSSVVWVVGLALICDTVPERTIGRQLGLALSGMPLGLIIGYPVSGALYEPFGFRGPFIFGVIVTSLDFLCRLLVIERKEALAWDVDPAAQLSSREEKRPERATNTTSNIPLPPPADSNTSDQAREAISGRPGSVRSEPLQDAADCGPSPVAAITPRISLWSVVVKLLTSSRAVAVFVNVLLYGVMYTSAEPAIPLHLQSVWGLDSAKVGLVYVAAVIPTVFSSALAGWWTDRKGTAVISVVCLILSLPWWGLLILQRSLALFVVAFALQSFFISGTVAPFTAELAAVTKALEGVGYAHVYGAFNIAFGLGSALGPIIGGQLYDHLLQGWMAICLLGIGLSVLATFLVFCLFGDEPLHSVVRHRVRLP